MKILLDTHVVLWAMDDNPKLTEVARKMILDSKNEIYYSTASVWETTIKHMSKPDKIMINGSKFSEYCKQMGYQTLSIEDKHVEKLETLVYHKDVQDHNDPFDRILIAQAKSEGMQFMTHDTKIPNYQEPCVISI